MELFECLTTRRSIRKFEKKPVDDKLIGVMLHMATQVPSAGNTQEWNFIVVKEEEQKKKLAVAALHQDFIASAPVVIVVCADLEKISLRYGERGVNLYSIQDTANATLAILLSAHALGLGSVWVGAFNEGRVKSILDLPDRLRPVAILPIGYPAEKPYERGRIPFENLTWTEKYGKKYEISFATQFPKHEVFEPLGYYIKKAIEKYKKARKEKKLSFLDFLKMKK